MIRIGVISDSHRDMRNVPAARAALGRIDWFLHAGDLMKDAPSIASDLGVEATHVRAVAGNCDYPGQEPVQEVLQVDGVKIWLTHGHLFGVKHGFSRVFYRAQEIGAQVAVFGHTHMATNLEESGVLLFNPGSLSLPRMPGDLPSCGLLEVADGRVSGRILRLNG